MARFIYTARDRQGVKVSGGVDAADKTEALRQLGDMGYTPVSIVSRDATGKDAVIAQVGQKYSTSLFAGEGLSETSLVLTARMLAGVGKTYTAKSKGVRSFCGDVKNVSSMGIDYSSNWVLLLLGILLLAAWGIGIIFLIFYYVSKERYIVVNLQGAVYALSLRGISNEDAQVFIEKVLNTAAAAS